MYPEMADKFTTDLAHDLTYNLRDGYVEPEEEDMVCMPAVTLRLDEGQEVYEKQEVEADHVVADRSADQSNAMEGEAKESEEHGVAARGATAIGNHRREIKTSSSLEISTSSRPIDSAHFAERRNQSLDMKRALKWSRKERLDRMNAINAPITNTTISSSHNAACSASASGPAASSKPHLCRSGSVDCAATGRRRAAAAVAASKMEGPAYMTDLCDDLAKTKRHIERMDTQVTFMAKELVQLSRDVRAIFSVLTVSLGCSDQSSDPSEVFHDAQTSTPFQLDAAQRTEADQVVPAKARLPLINRVNFCHHTIVQSAPSSAGLAPVVETLSSRSQSCDNVPIVEVARRLQGSTAVTVPPGNLRFLAESTGSGGHRPDESPDGVDSTSEAPPKTCPGNSAEWVNSRGFVCKGTEGGGALERPCAPADSGIDMGRDIDQQSRSTLLTTDL